MKFFVLSLAFLLIGCSKHAQNIRPQLVPPPQQEISKADGEYVRATLPCKCGDFVFYISDSCPCFDREHYPDLVNALNKVNIWARTHSNGSGKKIVGKYEIITLTCGCSLQVYVPGSSGCLEKLYPDLSALLKNIYIAARNHENKE